MRQKTILVGLLGLSILGSSIPVFAAEAIGTIRFIEGIADIARSNENAVPASEKDLVYLNDRIRTKSYSKAEIIFEDSSVLKLAPNTCVLIEAYKLSENNKRENARIQLTRGKVEAIVSKTGAPETFSINTPNAEGAVKGSDIFVSYLAGKTGVFVKEGMISVVNPLAPQSKVQVGKGDCVFVPFNDEPTQIRPALDIEMKNHKKDVEKELVKKWIASKDAQSMTATIVSTAGTARIYKNGAKDWEAVKQHGVVSEKDKLQTGEDGRIELRLSNGNSLFIEAGTELIFAILRHDPATGDYDNQIEMSYGKLSGIVEKIGKRSTFQVRTPTAVSAVRGTFLQVIAPMATPQLPTPPTQVFFEGGNGAVTSTLTGQMREIGAGQNVLVDVSGNVAPPVLTSPEQRTNIVQNLSITQTVDSYATKGGAATGLSSNPTQQALPPPPMPTRDGMAPAPLIRDAKSMELLSTLTFNQITNPINLPPPDTLVYRADVFKVDGPPTPSQVGTANMTFDLRNDHTWRGVLNGTYSGAPTITGDWDLNLNNAKNDHLQFGMTGGLGFSPQGNFTVATIDPDFDEVHGAPIVKTLSLTSGQGSYLGSGVGTFHATVNGRWEDSNS